MPPLATWLDLAWLAISLSCLIAYFFWDNRKLYPKSRTLGSTAVFVILIVLFPYFSASDDSIGLALLVPRYRSRQEATSYGPFDSLAGTRLELGIRLQELANVHATPFHPEPEDLHTPALRTASFRDFPWRPAPRQASRAPPSI